MHDLDKVLTNCAIRAIRAAWSMTFPDIPPPVVVPTVRGGIQLVWHTKGGAWEIYIYPNEPISAFVENAKSGESIEVPLLDNIELVMGWIQGIHAYREPEAEEQFDIVNLAANKVLAGTLMASAISTILDDEWMEDSVENGQLRSDGR